MRPLLLTTILFSIFTFHNTVYAQEYLPDKEGVASALTKKQFSPYVGREFPTTGDVGRYSSAHGHLS